MNDLELIIPNSIKINRGKLSNDELFKISKSMMCKYLIIVDSLKGNPNKILVYDAQLDFLKYSLDLKGVSTLSDFKIKRKKIISKFCLGKVECKNIIQLFLDLNLISLTRCNSFINVIKKDDYCEVSFIDKFQKYVGPILRINDFNINQPR
ncbi:hypothetical protein B6F84_07670 [Acidianus manzaensis]|uniref:Brix domain-containing protein n=1 Tax=Acidianus manzaensis TaxID=282676 RepID=A0A1W6K0A1_9CREN|nr:hypothetical protein B6F84_07670 [Acidianus manzaensis]